jgi:hypothetical protein
VAEARAAVAAAVAAAAAAGVEQGNWDGEDAAAAVAAEPMRFCLKMSAFPKVLERTAADVLLGGGVVGGF